MSTITDICTEIAEKIPQVYEAGKKAEHDAFWDEFFKTSGSFIGRFAGEGWTAKNFRPTKDILIVDRNANYCFYNNGCEIDLVKRCEELGINIVIKPTTLNNMFCISKFTHLPEINLLNASKLQSTFDSCTKLVTIDKLILKNDGSQTFPNAFNVCTALENIIIEGRIGNNFDIHWSPLTKESIESILNARSDTATFTMTFSEDAVNKAFETSPGANDGSTSVAWQDAINAKITNVDVQLAKPQ